MNVREEKSTGKCPDSHSTPGVRRQTISSRRPAGRPSIVTRLYIHHAFIPTDPCIGRTVLWSGTVSMDTADCFSQCLGQMRRNATDAGQLPRPRLWHVDVQTASGGLELTRGSFCYEQLLSEKIDRVICMVVSLSSIFPSRFYLFFICDIIMTRGKLTFVQNMTWTAGLENHDINIKNWMKKN